MSEPVQISSDTTAATAAEANASTPQPPPESPTESPVSDSNESVHYEIGARVRWASLAKPHVRTAGQPLYRPLRIFSLDPSILHSEVPIAIVNLSYEPLEEGPVGAQLAVNDIDWHAKCVWSKVNLDDHAVLLNRGLDPSVSEPKFHQQMVYAVCHSTMTTFRRALGRTMAWGFEPASEKEPHRLVIEPHAFLDRNAYYSPREGKLRFGYFLADASCDSEMVLPNSYVFTCLSHDIIAHEMTHALLDGLRAHFNSFSGPDVAGFHEGFADIVATLQHFAHREVVQAAIRQHGEKLQMSTLLSGIAQEFGRAASTCAPLRTAFDDKDSAVKNPDGKEAATKGIRRYNADLEAHDMGEVLVRAIFEAFSTVFERKIRPYLRLASGGTGRLPEGELSADLKEILGEQASKIASHFLNICIRAIDYCPPVDITLGDYLRALITADHELVMDDRWNYREALIQAFRRRAIIPLDVPNLSQESLLWKTAELSPSILPKLSFSNLRFGGDPAVPASESALLEQAHALGELLVSPQNLRKLGLAREGDPELNGDKVELPKIQSIRTSRRIGPDGQIVFDLVAEITQRRIVRDSGGNFEFFGGATMVVGPNGEVRYVICKNILSEARLSRQRDYVNHQGRRFWAEQDSKGFRSSIDNPFQFLHEPRA